MTAEEDIASVAGQLADVTRTVKEMASQLTEVRERLLMSVTPGVAPLECRAEGVPGVAAILEFVRFDCNLENVGFHLTPIRLNS